MKLSKAYLAIIILLCGIWLCGCGDSSETTTDDTAVEQTKQSADDSQKESNPPIAIYRGLALDIDDRNVDVEGVDEGVDESTREKFHEKYNREYYLYSDGTFLGKAQGKMEAIGYYAYWQITFPDTYNNEEVAISHDYDPYPRENTYTNADFPKEFNIGGTVLAQVDKQFSVNAQTKELSSVDLDGDGKNEYLALLLDKGSNFFAKCLVGSDFKVIAFITAFKEESDYFDNLISHYTLQDSGEIIDVNNDGIMEILVELPHYELFTIKLFTYKNGTFSGGDFITMTSIQP